MTIHQGISSHMLTHKCFSLFSLNPNKSQLLFISSSYHNLIRNMNLKVFYMVIMRLDFQKVLIFQITKIVSNLVNIAINYFLSLKLISI